MGWSLEYEVMFLEYYGREITGESLNNGSQMKDF